MADTPHHAAIQRISGLLTELRTPGSPLAGMFAASLGPPVVPPAVDSRHLDRSTAKEQVSRGALRSVRRGVLLPAADDPEAVHQATILTEVRGILAAARGPLWFSHATAALLHGAWTYATPPLVDVTHTFKPHVRTASEPLVRRHFTSLANCERSAVAGVPVTSPERTLVDCLRLLRPASALVVCDSLFRLGADPGEVSRIMTVSAGKRGMIQARRLLDLCDPRSGSPGETVARLVAVDDGLPRPVCQIPVETDSGTRFIDFGWPEVRAGVEFDGEVKYSGGKYGEPGDVVRRQQHRHDEIVAAGYDLVRVGWPDLANPLTLGQAMRAAYYRALRTPR